MVEAVLRLDIKPLKTYPKGKNRHTTLTSFEEVLKKKTESVKQDDKVGSVQKNITTRTSAASTSAGTDATSRFYDPSTGQAVKYVDVADSEAKAESTKQTTSEDRTTTADSMKKTKYDSYFKAAAEKYHVSESLLKGIAKAESNFNPNDVSSAGAIGVMQLMPTTAQSLGVKDPYDPEENIMGGAKCISQKLKEFHGDESLALAAYNAGSGAVKRYGGVPSYCKSYVSKVQSYKKAYETAASV